MSFGARLDLFRMYEPQKADKSLENWKKEIGRQKEIL